MPLRAVSFDPDTGIATAWENDSTGDYIGSQDELNAYNEPGLWRSWEDEGWFEPTDHQNEIMDAADRGEQYWTNAWQQEHATPSVEEPVAEPSITYQKPGQTKQEDQAWFNPMTGEYQNQSGQIVRDTATPVTLSLSSVSAPMQQQENQDDQIWFNSMTGEYQNQNAQVERGGGPTIIEMYEDEINHPESRDANNINMWEGYFGQGDGGYSNKRDTSAGDYWVDDIGTVHRSDGGIGWSEEQLKPKSGVGMIDNGTNNNVDSRSSAFVARDEAIWQIQKLGDQMGMTPEEQQAAIDYLRYEVPRDAVVFKGELEKYGYVPYLPDDQSVNDYNAAKLAYAGENFWHAIPDAAQDWADSMAQVSMPDGTTVSKSEFDKAVTKATYDWWLENADTDPESINEYGKMTATVGGIRFDAAEPWDVQVDPNTREWNLFLNGEYIPLGVYWDGSYNEDGSLRTPEGLIGFSAPDMTVNIGGQDYELSPQDIQSRTNNQNTLYNLGLATNRDAVNQNVDFGPLGILKGNEDVNQFFHDGQFDLTDTAALLRNGLGSSLAYFNPATAAERSISQSVLGSMGVGSQTGYKSAEDRSNASLFPLVAGLGEMALGGGIGGMGKGAFEALGEKVLPSAVSSSKIYRNIAEPFWTEGAEEVVTNPLWDAAESNTLDLAQDPEDMANSFLLGGAMGLGIHNARRPVQYIGGKLNGKN